MSSRLDQIAGRLRGTLGHRALGGPTPQEVARQSSETSRAVQDGFAEIAARFDAYEAIIRALAVRNGVTVDEAAPQTWSREDDPIEYERMEQRRLFVRSVLEG